MIYYHTLMDNNLARIDQLEKDVLELKSSFGKPKTKKDKRAPSEYNKFMKEYIANSKAILKDKYDHKVAFGEAAKEWTKQKK